MKISEYAEKARSLNFYPPAAKFFGPVFGISGESGELIEKIQHGGSNDEILKECGDVLWYLVNVLEDIQWRFVECVWYHSGALASGKLEHAEDSFTTIQARVNFFYENDCLLDDPISQLAIFAGKISEIAKKTLRDNNGVVPETKKKVVGKYVVLILDTLCVMATEQDLNMDNVAQANIDKLFDRRDRGVLGGSGDAR